MAIKNKKFANLFNAQAAKEEVKRTKERSKKDGGSGFYRPQNGTSVLRILPPGSEKLMSRGQLGAVVYKHWIDITIDGKQIRGGYVSGIQTNPEIYNWCPIQEALYRIEEVVDKKASNKLRAKPTAYFNAFFRRLRDDDGNDVDVDVPTDRPIIAELKKSAYDNIQESVMNDDIGFFVDPYDGTDFLVTRTGQGLETRYSYAIKTGSWLPAISNPNSSDEENEAAVDAMLEKLPDLEKFTYLRRSDAEKQVVVAKSILEWGSNFGDVDTDLGGDIEELIDRMGSSWKPEREEEDFSKKARGSEPVVKVQTQTKKAEPAPNVEEKVEAPEPSEGEGIPPKIDSSTGSPVCFGDFSKRNGGSTDIDNITDKQCAICDYNIVCAFGVD